MAKIAILFGAVLILLGLGAYGYSVTNSKSSFTALIPAIPGVFLLVFGLLGTLKPHLNKHMMHAAVIFAFLGGLAPIGGLVRLLTMDSLKIFPLLINIAMMVICLLFVVLCVMSFIKARKARLAGA